MERSKNRNGKKRQGQGQGWEEYGIEGGMHGKGARQRIREEKEKPAQVTLCKSVPI